MGSEDKALILLQRVAILATVEATVSVLKGVRRNFDLLTPEQLREWLDLEIAHAEGENPSEERRMRIGPCGRRGCGVLIGCFRPDCPVDRTEPGEARP